MLLRVVLALIMTTALGSDAVAAERPKIIKLGTIDCDMVETTPVVFKGKLFRFEWVRGRYIANTDGVPYFRFIDHETGEATPAFAKGHIFGSAFVVGDTVYVTGVVSEGGWKGQRIQMFASKDLKHWETWTALNLDGFKIYNTSICKAEEQYTLQFEIQTPAEQAGVAFTARFAHSKDLRKWDLTPPECNYAKDRYTAPHAVRYLDGYYYDFYLEAHEGYEMRVVRSKDLIQWEASPFNPVLKASADDKKIANPKLSKEQRKRIADAENINNSDIDFCEYKGQLIINYSWGDQKGKEFLAEAIYEGTEEEFIRAWFPEE